MVAHRAELAEAGDHLLVNVAGTPVVLLRAADGVLRAFPNVCRHRAGPLVLCSGKGLGNLRCKYHGWLYNQEGQLVAAPEMQEREGFPRQRRPAAATSRCGSGRDSSSSRSPTTCRRSSASMPASLSASRPVELGAMQFVRRDSLGHRVQLEGLRRQLPRGLPRPADPSGAVEGRRLPQLRGRAVRVVLAAAFPAAGRR